MPNGHRKRPLSEFGKHDYADHGTLSCKYGCGCWAGSAMSGGPVGIDPFGQCHENVPDESRDTDYEDLVNGRIDKLESEVYRLKEFEEIVIKSRENSKVNLVQENSEIRSKINRLSHFIHNTFKEIDTLSDKHDKLRKEIMEHEEDNSG